VFEIDFSRSEFVCEKGEWKDTGSPGDGDEQETQQNQAIVPVKHLIPEASHAQVGENKGFRQNGNRVSYSRNNHLAKGREVKESVMGVDDAIRENSNDSRQLELLADDEAQEAQTNEEKKLECEVVVKRTHFEQKAGYDAHKCPNQSRSNCDVYHRPLTAQKGHKINK